MKILFTGASSFTGYWFVRALARAGHDVVATFSAAESSYDGVRAERIRGLRTHCRPVFDCAFGSETLQNLIGEHDHWDLLCHHAATVKDYKSPAFDYAAALAANTRGLRDVLEALAQRHCLAVCLTGSVFEGGEGAGSQGLPAFSPYGLSKELTHRTFAHFCDQVDLRLGKFVISNPFGPFEEPRFTAYLIRTWAEGRVAEVRTPEYVRDNIHVDLLAESYQQFVGSLPYAGGNPTLNPSGYIESQGRFAQRFATAMASRLDLQCELDLLEQTAFDEPRVRINTEPATAMVPDWSEDAAWDAIADYYRAGLDTGRRG